MNDNKVIQFYTPHKVTLVEEYIDYFMIDIFPGKQVRESNNGKKIRKLLELLFRAYEAVGEDRKDFFEANG